jgi:ubiquinone/menaquinone biosynthesis C-methylase UbiE
MSQDPSSQTWKTESLALFDSEVEHYALERECMPYFQAQLRLLLEMIGSHQGRVLSIGCAAGGEFQALRDRRCPIVGVDYSLQMLQVAHGRFAADAGVTLARADAENLPFPDASFDIVTCLGVLEYLPSYENALREARRVLKPGGIVIYSLPTRISQSYVSFQVADAVLGTIWRLMKRLKSRPPVAGDASVAVQHHRNPCFPWQFRKTLRRTGFEPYDSAYTTFFLFPLDRFTPGKNIELANKLQRPLERSWLGWLGCQYMIAGRVVER